MNKLLVLLLLGTAVILLASCCCCFKGQPIELTSKDSGKTIKTTTGKTLLVVLEANATTGYSWKVTDYDKNILKLDKTDYKVDSELIGAGGKQFYHFSLIGKGQTELKIIYHRPWEKGVKPIKTFAIKVVSE